MKILTLSEEEIDNLFESDPQKLIKIFEDAGMSFEDIRNELDIGRTLVKSAFEIDENDIKAVEFVFWVSYFAERTIHEMICNVEEKMGARQDMLKKITGKLHFGDKISVISELYANGHEDALVKLLWKINSLRNACSHGRFSELVYSGLHLADLKGQIKLTMDIKNAALNESLMLRDFQ